MSRRSSPRRLTRTGAARSAVGVEFPLETALAHLVDVAPDVRSRAVDVGEPVLARELAGADRLLVPPPALGIRGQRDDRAADVARRLREREVGGRGPPDRVAPARLAGLAGVEHHLR